jgi:hypothetical protein
VRPRAIAVEGSSYNITDWGPAPANLTFQAIDFCRPPAITEAIMWDYGDRAFNRYVDASALWLRVARFARVVILGLPHDSIQRRNGRARILRVSSWRPKGVATFETQNRMQCHRNPAAAALTTSVRAKSSPL